MRRSMLAEYARVDTFADPSHTTPTLLATSRRTHFSLRSGAVVSPLSGRKSSGLGRAGGSCVAGMRERARGMGRGMEAGVQGSATSRLKRPASARGTGSKALERGKDSVGPRRLQ